ncbi:MAG: hypothetical protein IJQ99_08335 [Synergistaceae bacterium]|nr:hypothetical protein [Synergistaceae bacterium]
MKRLQYFAMLCVFVTLFAGSAWGADVTVDNAENLKNAIQDGANITLSADITMTEALTISTNTTVVINLNGHNITNASTSVLVNKGTLTITGNGEVSTTGGTYCAAIANFPNATCNVNGGTYKSKSWYVIKNFGTITIDGAVIVTPGDTDSPASLIDNGWVNATDKIKVATSGTNEESVTAQNDSSAKLYIKNGSFEGKSGAKSCSVVKNDDYGYLEIYDGTFDSTSNTGPSSATTIINWNEAHIYGGTFTGQYPISIGALNATSDQGITTIAGGTFTGISSLNGHMTDGNTFIMGSLEITDGTFSGDIINFSDDETNIAGKAKYTIKISGGNFTSDPTSYLASTKYKVAQKDSKYYVVKEILSSDITNLKATAIIYGQTLADSTITATVTFSGDVVSSSDYKLAWKDPTIKPSVSDSDKTSYDVVFTISDDTKYSIDQAPSLKLTVTVNKVDSSVTTAPTAVASLVANGTAQALITAGTAENGTMQYALGTDATTAPTSGYSTTIPTGTDAGKYYVWYKVVGDANHNNTEAKCITVTITAKAAATLSSFDVTISGDTALTATYGTSATKTFTASVKAGYSDGTTAALTSGYTLAWSTTSTDLADYELSFSNGTLTVSDLADVGIYNVPITATVTSGSIKGTATVTAKVTVNNVAPELSSTASTVTAKQGERITNVTVTATKGANITWSTNGTLPTGLTTTYTTTSTTFVIAGTVSASADVKTYDYSVIATNNISSATQKVTFTINSADVVVVQSDDQNPEKATIKAEDLKNATAEQLAEALTGKTELAIEGTVSDTEFAETLTKLASTGITALDLSSVSGLTTVDLKSNSKIETLDLGTNSSVKTVELSSTSSVKSMSLANSKVTTVNAEGCTSLTSVDVSGNTTIQTLTLTNTGVGDLNVASCDNLQTLETGSCESLEKVTLSGCKNLKTFKTSNSSNLKSIEGYQDCADTLTELDVSSCSLLRIDLANFKVLTNPNLGGQRRTGASILRKFSWWRFFFGNWWPSEATEQEGDVDYTKLIKITKASDSQGDISYSYNSDGEIEFVRTPTEFAYEFDSQLPDNSASEFKASAAAGGTMDVTISGSKGEADSDNPGGSGGGCETGIGILALSLCMILFINKKH